MKALDARMLEAHAAQDLDALVTLYSEAAEAASDLDAACFYLTHAYVYALDLGDTRAEGIRLELVGHGREPS